MPTRWTGRISITTTSDKDDRPESTGRRSKVLLWVGTFAALALIAGIGAVFAATRSGEASAGDAVEDFRAADSAGRSAPGLPTDGVYQYEVTGSETISQGPIDITRAFPGTSPVIITHTDDGYDWEWRLSSDRTETIGYTVDERGAFAASARSQLAVAGITSDVARDWSPPVWRFPLEPEVGQRFREEAMGSDGTNLVAENEVTGTDTLTVGGEQVDVTIMEKTLRFGGDTTGVVEETLAYVPESGLVVRYQSEEDFTGSGELSSTWDAKLTSLEPQQ